nr:programmed cell death protein 2-like isoform X1 [Coffea arabica]
MSEGEYDNSSGDPSEKLRTLKITSLDEEEDEEDAPMVDDVYEEEDDEEEEEEEGEEPVSLGFVESPKHSWSLSRELFASVAGGTPAWLDPTSLPTGRSCLCDFCAQPLQFLLQVYAPLLHKESTFHRTLFVFICPSMSCLLKDQHDQWKRQPEKAFRSVKVFRCQLPRFNSFYSSEPPRHDGSDRPTRNGAILCSWCGTWRGDKICSNCRIARYCSEKHQTAHWRSGHKIECRQPYMAPVASASTISDLPAETQKVASNHLWPQFEIVNEDECRDKKSEYDGFDKSLVSQSQMDEVKSLLDTFEVGGDKRSWAAFQERISREPEQVLRYYRLAKTKPLWPISSGRPSKLDIPRCNCCGGPRACEFQVLPQLLYYFGIENHADSLDWATIVVYTCEASCENRVVYKEEFAWVQLLPQSAATL